MIASMILTGQPTAEPRFWTSLQLYSPDYSCHAQRRSPGLRADPMVAVKASTNVHMAGLSPVLSA